MKKLIKLTICVLISVLILSACGKSEVIVTPTETPNVFLDYLINNNSSDYQIVCGSSATSSENFAASELQNFILQSTGAKIAVVDDSNITFSEQSKLISVGDTKCLASANFGFDYNMLGGSGFFIKTKYNSIFIDGNSDRGTIYGVYDFLEKYFGIKFLSDDYTYVPEIDNLSLYAIDSVEIPAFEERTFLSRSVVLDKELFALRCRMENEYLNMRESYGGNFGWYDGINPTHNALTYVSPDIYYPQYKDMFYVVDNKPQDLCYTNGITQDGKIDETLEVSAIKVAIQSLKNFVLDSNENDIYFMFGQMDILDCCQCDDCKAASNLYKRSGMMIRFANIMAEEVQKWANTELGGRKINVVVFAYLFSEAAPVKTNTDGSYSVLDETVIPADNVYVRMAPINSCSYYAYNEDGQIEKYRQMFEQWRVVTDKFMLWTYHTNFAHYFWYNPTIQSWKTNFELYQEMGVDYLFMQSSHTEYNNWQAIMETYIAAKMLWNPEQDVNKLQEEFIYYYFGETASPYILSFVENFNEHYATIFSKYSLNLSYNNSKLVKAELYPINFLEQQYSLVNQAESAVQASSIGTTEKADICKRIDHVKLTPQYMILYNYDYYYSNDTYGKYLFAKEFFANCDLLGVTNFSEMGLISDLKEDYDIQ